MAIRFPRREGSRKSVQAMRASENGRSGVDSWDKPTNTQGSPSNKELMAAKDAKTAARKKANDTPMAPVTFSKTKAPAGNEYRLQTGDD